MQSKISVAGAEIKGINAKSIGGAWKVEAKLILPLRGLDLDQLTQIASTGMVSIDIIAAQMSLEEAPRNAGPHPDQMNLDDLEGPMGHQPERVFVMLLSMPKEAPRIKKAESLLKKITGLKLGELRAELEGVSPDRPVTLRSKDGGDLFSRMDAIDYCNDLTGFGCDTKIVPANPPQEEPRPSIDPASLEVGQQYYWRTTGTITRIHSIDSEGVRAHSLYAHHTAIAPDVFARCLDPLPESEYLEVLNDEQVLNMRGENPVDLELPLDVRMELQAQTEAPAEEPELTLAEEFLPELCEPLPDDAGEETPEQEAA